MPALNAARYLAEAIGSVQAQTSPDWELLVVDDGSTDATLRIAETFARDDPRVRILPAAGARGAGAARNRGLAAAAAEFVAFLDTDDLFEPHKLDFDFAAFEAHPDAAMVYGPTLWWWQQDPARRRLERLGRYAGRLHRAPHLFADILINQFSQVPCTCAVLIRRAAVEAIGGFEERFDLYEDQTLWAKLMLRYPVFVHRTPTSRYRQHDASTSALAVRAGRYRNAGPHEARRAFLEWSAAEAARAGVDTPELRRALRLALAPYGAAPEPLSARDHLTLLKRRAGSRARALIRGLGRSVRA
jgi:glycosyltransferase involved in cell wall biosynthesis